MEYGTYNTKQILANYYLNVNDCSWNAFINWVQWKNNIPGGFMEY